MIGARGHRLVGPIGVLALLALGVVCYGHLFAGELIGDDNTFHLAEITRMRDCLVAGDWDLWNPSANAGYASAYYYQALPLLAPALASAVTGASPLTCFQWAVFVPLVLAGPAAYRAVRVLGYGPVHGLVAGFAVMFAMSDSRWGHGADGTFSVGLYTQTWAFAALPLAWAYGLAWLDRGAFAGRAVAWGLFVGLAHPFAGIALGVALGVGTALRIALGPALTWLGQQLPAWFTRSPDEAPPARRWRSWLTRLACLGLALLVGSASAWLPVLIDYDGFGGFPRRVDDEIGPGAWGLWAQFARGDLLDAGRLRILTVLAPIALVFGRGRYLAWLWLGALSFIVLLALGPLLVTADDLFPAVRFLGPLQIVLAIAVAIGVVDLAMAVWRWPAARAADWARGAVVGLGAFAVTMVGLEGVRLQRARVLVSTEIAWLDRPQLATVIDALAHASPGRKQAQGGTENHYTNLLPYVDARIPALLQMGGGGLQASPNYVYLWEERDPQRLAWIYDAPWLMFAAQHEATMPAGDTLIATDWYRVRRLPSPGWISPVEVTGTLPAGRFAARHAVIAWVRSADALADRVLAHDPDGLRVAPNAVVHASARLMSGGDQVDAVALVEARSPSTIVVRESWHPRWRLWLDGVSVPVRRVSPDFVAVDVPIGTHWLTARFDRPWWAWASWLLAPLAVAIMAWAGRRARVRARG